MTAYYNEIDPFACRWMQVLMDAGHIAKGVIDNRSIKEVTANDLRGFTQVHLFAGIGIWSHALRLAGWSDGRPIWTGSCPCQPFSTGNSAKLGRLDERHLWPSMYKLARELKPDLIIGEQVASAIEEGWLDEVFADLENEDYACGAAILRADSFGADHRRKRLYWMANASSQGRQRHQPTQRFSRGERETFPEYGNPLADARKALDGDFGGLLPCDGNSVTLERAAVRCFGNAIFPQVAKAWIETVAYAIGDGAK